MRRGVYPFVCAGTFWSDMAVSLAFTPSFAQGIRWLIRIIWWQIDIDDRALGLWLPGWMVDDRILSGDPILGSKPFCFMQMDGFLLGAEPDHLYLPIGW